MSSAGITPGTAAGRGLRGLPLFIARALEGIRTVFAPSPAIDIDELLQRLGKPSGPSLVPVRAR
jgi:hypothetical protein